MTLKIPKRIGHIWIGPHSPPLEVMSTWRIYYPDWEYTLYDNSFLLNFPFRTHAQIREYMMRGDYPAIADLMRYEILYAYGGIIAEADSTCLKSAAHLFEDSCAYTVYENEFVRGKLVSPIMACEPGNKFVGELIEELSSTNPKLLHEAWRSTGNLFLARMIRTYNPDIVVFPSHYFIPWHFEGETYDGQEPVYALQRFGSTTGLYKKNRSIANKLIRLLQRYYRVVDIPSKRRRRAVRKTPQFEVSKPPSNKQGVDKLVQPSKFKRDKPSISVLTLLNGASSDFSLSARLDALDLGDGDEMVVVARESNKENVSAHCQDSRIHLSIVESQSTIEEMLQNGFKIAKSDLVLVVDSSDHILPNYLERIRSVCSLENTPPPTLGCAAYIRRQSKSLRGFLPTYWTICHLNFGSNSRELEHDVSACSSGTVPPNFGSGFWFNKALLPRNWNSSNNFELSIILIALNQIQNGEHFSFDLEPGIELGRRVPSTSKQRSQFWIDSISMLKEYEGVFAQYPNLSLEFFKLVQDAYGFSVPYIQIATKCPQLMSLSDAFKRIISDSFRRLL